ncbi:MAG: hypothetical protein KBF57_01215 [Saprospiraceae bacterium]|jgi:hypothetical protein|nr:hypothetical protein [Saprospiraceae bacterium]MBP9193271.1 hypothetical protein [Saprospiraceae bacterium]
MNQYTITNTLRTILFSMMGIGLLCLVLTWMGDDHGHTRFWSNVLHNSVFFTGIAIMATFFMAASITAYAGWYTAFKRVFESISTYLLPGFVIMTLIGVAVYMHMNHLYHWADDNSVATDEILKGKSGFLNKNWYLFGTILIGAAYVFIAMKLRSLSIAEESSHGEENFATHRRIRTFAAMFLPIFGFTSVVLIWQWVMSVDAHWYSTMFAWYSLASLFVAMMCVVALVLMYLRSKGYYQNLTQHHMHDVGKFIFGISVFWTYLWFSQFMLIWYANIGEETIYFKERYDNYPVLFFGNFVINFVLPFLVLMRNDTKWKNGSLSFVAIVVFIGHWLDFFLMVKPGVLHTAHEVGGHGAEHGAAEAHGHAAEHVSSFVQGFTFPGLLELGTMLGFLGLFLFVMFNALSKAKLTSEKDPYVEESLHHHV